MTHTLRRSKSKYARTRRQHKKQRRIRGGGFLNDVGNTIVGAFKPSTDEEKCKELKEAAQTACSKVAVGEGTAEYGASSSTTPVGDRISSSTSSSIIPVGKGLSGSGEGFSGSDTVLSSGSDTTGLSSGSGDELSSGSGDGLSSGSGDELSSGKGPYSAASFTPLIRDVKSPLGGVDVDGVDVSVDSNRVAAAAAGGAKKSKKRNKKRSQSRRKKLKSRKHKK